MYQKSMLHAAIVELVAKKGAKIRYITIQNWSKNVYNLVTKRAHAYENASVTWLNGEVGSGRNMKYPVHLSPRQGRIGGDPLDGLRRREPDTGHRREGDPPRLRHLVEDHLKVRLQGRRRGDLPRASPHRKGRAQRKGDGQVRRAPAGRAVEDLHHPIRRGHGGRRDRHPRGERREGRRGADLLPDGEGHQREGRARA